MKSGVLTPARPARKAGWFRIGKIAQAIGHITLIVTVLSSGSLS